MPRPVFIPWRASVPDRIRLLILGTGTFAMEVTDLITDLRNPGYTVEGYVESLHPEKAGSTLLERPVHWVDDLGQFCDSHLAVCALGTPRRHTFVEKARHQGMRFATLIHPGARVSRTVTIGEGTIISPGTVVASYTEIGSHVIINRGALIGHHIQIADYVTISPGVNLAGGTSIGTMAYVGMGANVLETLEVGEGAVIGAGSVVTRDVPPHTRVMGVPARSVPPKKGSM